jgi:hypothetical protein
MRHIFRQFPNNRFVTRQYSRFAEELLADRALSLEMVDKSRLLQRDIPVSVDRAHDWGTHAFPNLPERTQLDRQGVVQESISIGEVSDVDAEIVSESSIDEYAVVSSQLNNISFPGIRRVVCLQVSLFVLFVCVEIPVLIALAGQLQTTMLKPLEYFNYQSMWRTASYCVNGLSQQVIYTRLQNTTDATGRIWSAPPIPPRGSTDDPVHFGGSWDLGRMLTYWTRKLTVILQDVTDFRAWESDDPDVQASQSELFDVIHSYTYFDGGRRFETVVALQIAFTNMLSFQADIVASEETTPDDLNSSILQNMNYNCPNITPKIQNAINYLVRYVQRVNAAVEHDYTLAIYISLGVGVAVILASLVLEMRWIWSTKEKVYFCLTALPKTHVSQMADNMRVRKREAEHEEDADMNKQEDNVMKVFVAGSVTSGSGIIDQFVMSVCVVVTAGLFAGSLLVIRWLIADEAATITSSMPHIAYVQGSYSAIMQAVNDLFMMYWFDTPFENFITNKQTLIARFHWLFVRFNEMYTDLRFGDLSAGLPPYSGYLEGSRIAEERLVCGNAYAVPKSLLEACDCFRPDFVFGMMEALLNARVAVFEKRESQVRLLNPARAQQVFSMMIYPIYELLIEPMHVVIDETIIENLDTRVAKSYITLAVLLTCALIFEVGALIQIKQMDTHMRRVLKLLLHCPAGVIMHTPRLMTVLSGDFRSKRWEDEFHTPAFFRQVVMQLPESVVTLDSEKIIRTMNSAAERMFGPDILNSPLAVFLREPRFAGNLAELVAVPSDGTAVTGHLLFQKSATVALHFEATAQAIQETFVYTFRDTTTSTRYDTLLTSERAKCDQLLRSILPSSLAARVAMGERNISFSVSSVTVVFMDIVGFTPWCSVTTPEKIMAVLNALFKMFDHHCVRHSTMTPIKCIGDC